MKLVDIKGRKTHIRKIGIINQIFGLVCTQIHVIIHPTIKKNTEKQTWSLSIRKLVQMTLLLYLGLQRRLVSVTKLVYRKIVSRKIGGSNVYGRILTISHG